MNPCFALQALMGVLTDPLGTPLFDARMAAAGLPLSADINSITDFWDDSITDQVLPPAEGAPPMGWFQMVELLIGIGVLAAAAAALSVVLQKRRARAQAPAAGQLQTTTPRLSRRGAELSAKAAKSAQPEVEMAGPSCEAGSVMVASQAQFQLYDEQLNLSLWSENSPLLLNEHHHQHQQPFPSDWAEGQLAFGAERPHGRSEASSQYPFREDSCSNQHGQLHTQNCSSNSSDHSLSLSQVEFSSERGQLLPVQSQGQGQLSSAPGQLQSGLGQGQGQVQLPGPLSGPVQAWVINPEQIKICEHPKGGPWQLGSGSFGVVSLPLAFLDIDYLLRLQRHFVAA